MKFIHFADSHLDGFKEDRLNRLSIKSFLKIIDDSIKEKVDFVILSGDLFNTALPRVDALKEAIAGFKKLQDVGIPVYAIPGSHDFSPRGRSMFEVLEKGGFLINVMKGEVIDGNLNLKYTVDEKTGTFITGIMGKKGMLDREIYENVVVPKKPKNSFSIFLFHTAISELRPKYLERMEAYPLSFLPEGFDYYAGGHVHIRKRYEEAGHRNVVYPGPTFPNSFSELEELKQGSYVFYDSEMNFFIESDSSKTVNYKFVKLPSKNIVVKKFNLENEKSISVVEKCISELSFEELNNSLVLLRFEGELSEGKPRDINFNEILKFCYDGGSYLVLKNTYKLQGKELDEVDSKNLFSETLEEETIAEYLGRISLPNSDEKEVISKLLNDLDIESLDGEKKSVFLERVLMIAKDILE